VKIGDGSKLLIVCLYVDDLIFTRNDGAMFNKFKNSIMKEFEMTNLGNMHYFLGLVVVQSNDAIFVCQKKYVRKIQNRFKMKDCNSTHTPVEFGLKLHKDEEGEKVDSMMYKQMVSSLMCLTAIGPDIMYAVRLISKDMENPTIMHLLTIKRIIPYLQGTKDFGLFYKKDKQMILDYLH